MSCKCVNWCRVETEYKGRSNNGFPLYTNHHPNCEHYNDSLIDVFKVEFDGSFYYSSEKPEIEDGETVTEVKIHREIYEHLPEFGGF